MGSILVTCELGENLGHVTRLLAIATGLRQAGYLVIAAVREIPTTASIFSRFNVPFIQAPYIVADMTLVGSITSYADILLAHGWRDPAILWSYVSAWTTLYRVVNPDFIIHDASPCARLSSWICDIPSLCIGNGYDVPPDIFPLPLFPGLGGPDSDRAPKAEMEVLENANAVIAFYKGRSISGLRELFFGTSMLITFPELDHYGPRAEASYTGTLSRSVGGTVLSEGFSQQEKHIFAYLRKTHRIANILEGLVDSGLNVICVTPDLDDALVKRFESSRTRFYRQPIPLDCIYDTTSVCFSYSPEGTVTSFLLRGIPQILVPSTIERSLLAERVREMGAGLVLHADVGARDIKAALCHVVQDENYRRNAKDFGNKHSDHSPAHAVNRVVARVRATLGG